MATSIENASVRKEKRKTRKKNFYFSQYFVYLYFTSDSLARLQIANSLVTTLPLIHPYSKFDLSTFFLFLFLIQLLLKKIVTVLFTIACFGGWLYQVFEISSKYFEYSVGTRVYQDIQDEIQAPEISVCFRYVDIFNRDQFGNLTGRYFKRPIKEYEINELQASVTVKDIFTFTPYEFDSLEDCAFSDGKFRRIHLDSRECYNKFHVSKFYTQEFICYHFKFGESIISKSSNITYSYDRISYSLTEPGTIFSLDFNKTLFEPVDTMKAIISQRSYPFRSRAFSPVISRHYNPTFNNASYDLIKVSYSVIGIYRLEPPYETKCVAAGDKYLFPGLCKQKCLIGKVSSQLNRIPYSTVITKAVNLQHVNAKDLNESDFVNKLVNIEAKCSELCNYSSCEETYSRTEINKEDVTPNDEFRVVIETPRAPAVTIRYSAKLSFAEYLLYISSTVGVWFGLSVIHLNPLQSSTLQKILFKLASHFNIPFVNKNNKHFNHVNHHVKSLTKEKTIVNVISKFSLSKNSNRFKGYSNGYSNPCLYCLETRLMIRSINIQIMSLRAMTHNMA